MAGSKDPAVFVLEDSLAAITPRLAAKVHQKSNFNCASKVGLSSHSAI